MEMDHLICRSVQIDCQRLKNEVEHDYLNINLHVFLGSNKEDLNE